jgi:hypothetical protein
MALATDAKDEERVPGGVWNTLKGTAALVFAAIGVVVQLKEALNTVCEIKNPPGKGVGLRSGLCPVACRRAGHRIPAADLHAAHGRPCDFQ